MLHRITLLLAYGLYYFVLKTSDVLEMAILNARKDEMFPYLRAVLRNIFDLKSVLILHKEQYKPLIQVRGFQWNYLAERTASLSAFDDH